MDHDLGKLIGIMRVVGDNRQSCAAASEDARRWCDGHDTCNHCRAALIDAIEREIASAKSAAYDQGYDHGYQEGKRDGDDEWYEEHESYLEEHCWYQALDADKEVIHADDELFWKDDGETAGRVTAIGVGQRAGWVWTLFDGCSVSTGHHADMLRHYHAPTVEDVLYDSLKHFGAVEERTPEVDSWVCEQAAKLRKMLAGSDAE